MGDPRQSLAVLRPRSHYRHVRRMIDDLERRMAELTKPLPTIASAPAPSVAPAATDSNRPSHRRGGSSRA